MRCRECGLFSGPGALRYSNWRRGFQAGPGHFGPAVWIAARPGSAQYAEGQRLRGARLVLPYAEGGEVGGCGLVGLVRGTSTLSDIERIVRDCVADMQVTSVPNGVLRLYQKFVRSPGMVESHLPSAGPPAAESTPAVARPPGIARFLMGNHSGIALVFGTPPTPVSAIMAQAEVGPAYMAL